jgi:putative intracellular protease/amidase
MQATTSWHKRNYDGAFDYDESLILSNFVKNQFMSISQRALAVLTNHCDYPTKAHKTGLWLSELTHFCEIIARKGINIDFMSPKGGAVPIDQKSLNLKDTTNRRYYEDAAFRQKLENTHSPSQIDATKYQIIYFAGGHGTMWDFPNDTNLQNITRQIYENGGIVSAVCHGVAGLLNTTLSDGTLLIEGRRITGFSNIEERLAGLTNEVPFLLQEQLASKADYHKVWVPFMPYIKVSERLVTGQNPASTRKVARKILEELYDK